MVSVIPSVSVIGPRPRSGTYAMWYGNRSVATAYRELRTTRRRCSPRTHPCSHAVSRYLFEDLPSGACVLQQNRKREPGRRRIRTYPGRYGRIGNQPGQWSVRCRTVQRLLAPLLSGWARRMQQGGLDPFKADLEGPLAGFSTGYKGLCSLALAALLTFLAWRFSFRLLDAAFLLLRPPLSFLAIGVSFCPACDDCGPPLCHFH